MSSNQKLRDEPKKFFKTYSVKAGDGINGASMSEKPAQLGGFYSRVRKKNLVSYLNVEARAKYGRQLAMKAPKGTYTVDELGQYAANEGADTLTIFAYSARNQPDFVPAFFLPWDQRGGAVEMTIPPRPRNHTPDTYPKLFLTAAINGCSVFVTGTQANPKIFHCGIGTGTEDAINRWRNLVKDISGLSDAALREVNKSHYVKDDSRDMTNMASTSHVVAFEKTLVDHYKGTEIQIVESFPWGAVFGLCDDAGLWQFYLQENITITYRRQKRAEARKWYQGKPKPTFEDLQVARPIAVRKFFPDGGGLVKMQTRYEWRSLRS